MFILIGMFLFIFISAIHALCKIASDADFRTEKELWEERYGE